MASRVYSKKEEFFILGRDLLLKLSIILIFSSYMEITTWIIIMLGCLVKVLGNIFSELFLETLLLVWMVKHWNIRWLSQNYRLWGVVEMRCTRKIRSKLWARLELNNARTRRPLENAVPWSWLAPMTKPGRLKDGPKQGSSLPLHPWQTELWFIVRSQGQRHTLLRATSVASRERIVWLFLCGGAALPHQPSLWDYPWH